MELTSDELTDLKTAKSLLTGVSFAMKVSNAIGRPIEEGIKMLPEGWQNVVNTSTKKSLEVALDAAIYTMQPKLMFPHSDLIHKLAVAATGATAVFGFASLPFELPITTVIMLRSISDIAAKNGENLELTSTKLACMEVFALGGSSKADDAAEMGYYAVRSVLAREIDAAVKWIARKELVKEAAPPLVSFVSKVAARFGITLTEELAAKAIPVVGALTGSTVNVMFMNHFQDMATGHFMVRKLERKYTPDLIKNSYEKID